MSRMARAWSGGLGVASFFLLVAWATGTLLGLEGTSLWLLRGGLILLGLVAAALLARLLWVSGPDPSDEGGPDDVDLTLAAAGRRLAGAGAGGGRLGRLPLTLVLGPRGSTKTTLLSKAGLDTELLAGEVMQGETVVDTEGVNVWYAQGSVIVEAGGALLADERRWDRLLRRLRPSRWGAVFGRGGQPARSVVVCFAMDEFLKPGSGEGIPAYARLLRTRLARISETLGVAVPVYVIFTRADRFPFFADYVRTLRNDEVADPVGATLSLGSVRDSGRFAEEQGGRIRSALAELHRNLAANRLRVLPRENALEPRGGAYEFPRELRKVSETLTSFLVEICRPSQFGRSPVLRGFYFTGVRPIVVSDGEMPASAATPAPSMGNVGATGVFNIQQLREEEARRQAPAPGGSRRVPQWVFFERLFTRLIPGDENARALTAGGARVDVVRRVGLAGLVLIACIASIGFTVSFFGNRSLGARMAEATSAVEALRPEPGTPPSVEELTRLDELRLELTLLRQYETEGPPRRLRWGLYRGSDLLTAARPIYFGHFDDMLWATTRARLAGHLDGLSGTPGEEDDYGFTYDALKAYLVTTRYPERSEEAFLGPALTRFWPWTGEVGEERRDLARAQFGFFATELKQGHPLPMEADDRRVAQSRGFLLEFAELDRVYQALLADGSAGLDPIQFARLFPDGAGALRNEVVIPGAFTEEGWGRVQAALDDVDRLFAAEEWVVGEQAISAEGRAQLASDLRTRYVEEYIANWQRFLEAAAVPGFGSVAEAARRLSTLSGNQSPVLQVLAITSRNTAVDSVLVAPAFQPVHAASPPEVRDRFIAEPNEGYMAGLVNLHASLEQLSDATGPRRDQLMMAAAQNAEQAKLTVRQLAQQFSVEGDAQVAARQVQRIMEAPITLSEALITRLPAAAVNAQGQAFCAAFNPVLAKYPFASGAGAESTMDELQQLFQPGSSALWSFYDEVGRSLLAPQGPRYVAAPGASPQPSADFVRFFNRAADVSRALFDDQGRGPEVVFALRPETSEALPEVGVTIDGQAHRFTRTMAAAHTFIWDGNRARDIRITGQVGGQEATLLESSGSPWSLFRLFRQAQWEQLAEGRYRLTWQVPGRQLNLSAELSLARGIPVFRGDFMGGLSCVSRIAQ
jgi:type VI secretion system protein ImpL